MGLYGLQRTVLGCSSSIGNTNDSSAIAIASTILRVSPRTAFAPYFWIGKESSGRVSPVLGSHALHRNPCRSNGIVTTSVTLPTGMNPLSAPFTKIIRESSGSVLTAPFIVSTAVRNDTKIFTLLDEEKGQTRSRSAKIAWATSG